MSSEQQTWLAHVYPSRDSKEVVILDGALATELERRTGQTLDTPLWSAQTLLTQPQLIQQVHLDYFQAGARCAITSSYQASTQGLAEQQGMTEQEAADVVRLSVEVAQDAREQAKSQSHASDDTWRSDDLLIAGSVGPYGAYLANGSEYTGSYSLPSERMQAFHYGRIAALLDAGADLLAIETQPSLVEIRDILDLLNKDFPAATAWVSCTLRETGASSPPSLGDGSSLHELCELVNAYPQVIAVGVNCCPKRLVTEALREMKAWTSKPLVAYPNSGEVWDAHTKSWHGNDVDDKGWDECAVEWTREGAMFVGGCCRTTPADITAIKSSLENLDC